MESKVELDGANRGGRAFAQALCAELPRLRLAVPRLAIVDPEPDRARDLAASVQSQGLSATAEQRAAPHACEAAVRIEALDDAQELARITKALPQSQTQLLLPTILVAGREHVSGGCVWGFGGAVDRSDHDRVADAVYLFSRLADLAGDRQRSLAVSSPLLNLPQLRPARCWLHQQNAANLLRYATGQRPNCGLWAYAGMERQPFEILEIIETKLRDPQRLLRQVTEDVFRPASANRPMAVISDEETGDMWLVGGGRWGSKPVVTTITVLKADSAPPGVDATDRLIERGLADGEYVRASTPQGLSWLHVALMGGMAVGAIAAVAAAGLIAAPILGVAATD